ncbi:hypothetical protein ZIOFF_037640 [Zingiber officinale]|uniref:BZIP domain-containing protein n=1 Tax=Zingiber officinale TaxID=94328 RepID=A0A8J5L9U5_ZINOF|nr:hypothetical protein ZIOFF_037640 [Zingiber officinale]
MVGRTTCPNGKARHRRSGIEVAATVAAVKERSGSGAPPQPNQGFRQQVSSSSSQRLASNKISLLLLVWCGIAREQDLILLAASISPSGGGRVPFGRLLSAYGVGFGNSELFGYGLYGYGSFLRLENRYFPWFFSGSFLLFGSLAAARSGQSIKISWTDTSTDVDTDDKDQRLECRQLAAVAASDSSDRSKDKMLDQKTLRRLAQNREAARKSRLRKKVYHLYSHLML